MNTKYHKDADRTFLLEMEQFPGKKLLFLTFFKTEIVIHTEVFTFFNSQSTLFCINYLCSYSLNESFLKGLKINLCWIINFMVSNIIIRSS